MVGSERTRRRRCFDDWLVSWKLLLACATLFAVGAVTFAVWGITTLSGDQNHAADFAGLALVFLAAVGVATLLVSLPLAYLLKRGGLAGVVAATIVASGGTFVYVTSGFFLGLLPVFVAAITVGGLGLSETLGTRENEGHEPR